MKKLFTLSLIVMFVCLLSSMAQADNVTELLNSAKKHYAAHNFSKALEDLEWARKEISSQHLKSMKAFFPANIDGMRGTDVDSGDVMGVRGVTREYSNNDQTKSVVISFLSGSNTASANGLGALMSMASSMGFMNAGGNSKVVIEKGYKGQFIQEGGDSTGRLTFNLREGKIIVIETTGYKGSFMAEKVAKMLNITKIERSF